MNPINKFEIPTTDLARAQTFYERVFQIKLEVVDKSKRMTMAYFPGGSAQSGAMGALVHTGDMTPSLQGSVVYFRCNDLNEELERIKEYGGEVLFAKTPIGDNGYIAHFCDTEGNRIGLHSMK